MFHDPAHGSAFHDSWDFSDIPESTTEIVKVIDEAKTLAKQLLYNTNVYAVVSDNAANMVSMGNSIDEWHSTCSSHTANLLVKDLVDSNRNDKVTKMLKIFTKPEFEKKKTSFYERYQNQPTS